MSILTVFSLASMNPGKYNQIITDLADAGVGNPEGRSYHVASLDEDGSIIVTDVWDSAELLDEFSKTLIPILEKNGVTPVEPKVYPVHNVIEAAIKVN